MIMGNIFRNINSNSIMRQVVILLDEPIKFILLLMLVLTLIMVGELVAEFLQRRYIDIKATRIINKLKDSTKNIEEVINNSKLLPAHKDILLEVTKNKNFSNEMKENLAVAVLDNYERRLDIRIKRTEMIVRLGPVFGLLGTLIPLGPGIIALAQGDTLTLSNSLISAFDTTVIGLICAAISTVLTSIRKNWYDKDKIMLVLIMEAILENEEGK